MVIELGSRLGSLRAAGARITLGVPASEGEVAAIAARAGIELPPDYVGFLRELGALRIETELPGMPGDLRFVGHAPGDPALDVALAIDALPVESERWGQPVQPAAPVLVYGVASDGRGAPGSECMVIARDGAVHHFRRGELDRRGSFEALLEGEIDELLDMLELFAERRERALSLASTLRALVPAELVAPSSTDERLVLRRADGAEIALEVGSWRETYGTNDGLVLLASWLEPSISDDAARNAWNRDGWLARATASGSGTRCTARIHVDGLDARRFLAALAHDARLPLPDVAPTRPDLDALASLLSQRPPQTPEQRLLDALMGRRTGSPHREGGEPVFRREDDALVGPSTRGLATRRAPVEIRIRIGPTGLVEIVHTQPLRGSRADALSAAAAQDDGVRVWVDDDTIGFALVTSDGVLGTDAFVELVNELEDAVARASR